LSPWEAAAFALVGAVAPTNELEAAMALQMVAANEAALMGFERSRTAQFIERVSAYSNMAKRLSFSASRPALRHGVCAT
jgi:hypothetical protein